MDSELEGYDLEVELYYAEGVSNSLRKKLDQSLGEKYREKYTQSYLRRQPIMNIKLSSEVVSLFGEDIDEENVFRVLEDQSEI